jgi:hypothetical protein
MSLLGSERSAARQDTRAGYYEREHGTDPESDRLLRDEKWSGDPLFLMIAGLVAGAVGVKNALARTDLATTIAQRELDRIGQIAAGAGIEAKSQQYPGFAVQHMAVLATLGQGLSLSDARELIEDEKRSVAFVGDTNATIQALRQDLPGTGEGRKISPILPDIVGEAAIMFWLGKGGGYRPFGGSELPRRGAPRPGLG